MYTAVNGIKFYLRDDIDTLICKLQNIKDDYYYNNKSCNINKNEDDLKVLITAFEEDDVSTMKKLWNEYHMLFKRYR